MQIGLFSNGHRLNEIARTSYEEDLYELVLADQLGIQEAWISEHGSLVGFQRPDQVANADHLICKAAGLTRQIRLGPGIRALPYYHPLQVATDMAECDHLTDGRYLAGFGVGLGGAGKPQRGPVPGDPRAMTREAIDLILTAWTARAPFDWKGQFWSGEGLHIIPQPLTKPHMDVGIAVARTEGTLELAAQKGFFPLLSFTDPAERVAEMVGVYLRTPGPPHTPARRSRVRVSRYVYVADSVEQAKQDLRHVDIGGPLVGGRLDRYIPAGGTRADLTMDELIDQGVFCCGDPATVYEQLQRFYEATGGFGVLLLAVGKDWGTRAQRTRSLQRFMEEVAPRLAALDPDEAPAGAGAGASGKQTEIRA